MLVSTDSLLCVWDVSWVCILLVISVLYAAPYVHNIHKAYETLYESVQMWCGVSAILIPEVTDVAQE